jgi:hypothetical protein
MLEAVDQWSPARSHVAAMSGNGGSRPASWPARATSPLWSAVGPPRPDGLKSEWRPRLRTSTGPTPLEPELPRASLGPTPTGAAASDATRASAVDRRQGWGQHSLVINGNKIENWGKQPAVEGSELVLVASRKTSLFHEHVLGPTGPAARPLSVCQQGWSEEWAVTWVDRSISVAGYEPGSIRRVARRGRLSARACRDAAG